MSGTGGKDHGWRGSGRFRVARHGGALVVRFAALTSKRSKLKSDIGGFFRKSYRATRPDYRAYAVHIWIEGAETRRIDVDNVAKACLDALTGVVWRDDSQVVRLTVEKVSGDQAAVTLSARAVGRARTAPAFRNLLAEIDAAD